MKITGINVAFAYVEDLQASKEFYGEALCLGEPKLDTPSWVEWELAEGANIAIHKASDAIMEGSVPDRSTIRFSIVVDDIKNAYNELFERGVRIHSEPQDGPGFLFVDFHDPDGNPLRLIQFLK